MREARTWARRIMTNNGDSARLTLAYHQALSREPSATEVVQVEQTLKSAREGKSIDADAELSTWASILGRILSQAAFYTVR